MYHSVTIGSKNTWDDWHLIPTSRPTPSIPKRVDKVITIPGANYSLDMSSYLAGHNVYSNRTGSFAFAVVNDYRDWFIAESDISNYLQNIYTKMVLEDEPDYYYIGRFNVESWSPNKNWSEIAINYDLYPFKKPVNLPREFVDIDLTSGDKTITFDGTVEYGSPIIKLKNSDDKGIRVYHSSEFKEDDQDYTSKNVFYAHNGQEAVKGLHLGPGSHTITFSGKGILTFDYRGGII